MNLDLNLKPDRLLNVFKTEEQGKKQRNLSNNVFPK